MDRVFSFLLWPKREARGPWKQGRKKRGSITCCTDRANEANKMFIIWLCRLFRFWKASGPYGNLRTWNWPITAREISQPYNKVHYSVVWDTVCTTNWLHARMYCMSVYGTECPAKRRTLKRACHPPEWISRQKQLYFSKNARATHSNFYMVKHLWQLLQIRTK